MRTSHLSNALWFPEVCPTFLCLVPGSCYRDSGWLLQNVSVHLYSMFSIIQNFCLYYTKLWQHVSVPLDHHQANMDITSIAKNSYINWYIMFMVCIYHVILSIYLCAPVWCISECVFYSKTHSNICRLCKWKYLFTYSISLPFCHSSFHNKI
jgi:hypothetical protein